MYSVSSDIKTFNETQNDNPHHSFMSDLKDAVNEISGLYLHFISKIILKTVIACRCGVWLYLIAPGREHLVKPVLPGVELPGPGPPVPAVPRDGGDRGLHVGDQSRPPSHSSGLSGGNNAGFLSQGRFPGNLDDNLCK